MMASVMDAGTRVAIPSAQVSILDPFGRHDFARSPRLRDGRGAFGLNADHLRLRMASFGRQACSADAAPQPDRNQDRIGIGKRLKNLPRHAPHAGDQVRLIRRVDVAPAARLDD
jgi:hypothetical protein